MTIKKIHPPEDHKRLMTRCTEAEYANWAAAAKKEGLTIGPWSRMILNRAARELGIPAPVASVELDAWGQPTEPAQ